MTLLDAPVFNEARDRRNRMILGTSVGAFLALFLGFWLLAGRPVDWPWKWNQHLQGKMAVNSFFKALERNDMPAAFGIWNHDKDWQQHPAKYSGYPFERFEKDWSADSPDNEYGPIKSHRIAATRVIGNHLLTATFINGRKSKAANLVWDPADKTLHFAPDDEQFLEGAGGIS
jgi:hypothetical protein